MPPSVGYILPMKYKYQFKNVTKDRVESTDGTIVLLRKERGSVQWYSQVEGEASIDFDTLWHAQCHFSGAPN